MGDGWWEEQGERPGEPALHLANGDLKLIFHIPGISSNNWFAGHGVFEGCCFPASPSLRLRIHISAPEIVFSDLSVGWWVLFCPTQKCPDVNNIQTKTRTALINTSWFVSGSSKASVNNLEKRIRSNLKQASLSGKQLAASLIAWKNIFSAQLHFSDAFYVAAHVTPREDEWAQMWFEHLTSSIHPPPHVFSSLMLSQPLISQADKRTERAFPRWWQILIKFKCWSYCLDYKLLRTESDLALVFAYTPRVQKGIEVPMCHCCKVSVLFCSGWSMKPEHWPLFSTCRWRMSWVMMPWAIASSRRMGQKSATHLITALDCLLSLALCSPPTETAGCASWSRRAPTQGTSLNPGRTVGEWEPSFSSFFSLQDLAI